MNIPKNELLFFNAEMLLSKSEVIESFNAFVEHHETQENEEGYSEEKRKNLLELCDKFLQELFNVEVPTLKKPWLFYDYFINDSSIELTLNRCNHVEFDDEGYISEMRSEELQKILIVEAEYLTVEEFAQLYNVTDTTVRQWIRRGKLRTAKKDGNNWLIPSIEDKPARGFQSVFYYWEDLDTEILEAFPMLADTSRIYIYQDGENKKEFNLVTYPSLEANRNLYTLTIKERERLELMLITSKNVTAESLFSNISFTPGKRNFELPILENTDLSEMGSDSELRNIIVKNRNLQETSVFLSRQSSDSYFAENSLYFINIWWDIYTTSSEFDDEDIYEKIEEDELLEFEKVGTLEGVLILCDQMIEDGVDPLEVCDEESGDLEFVMSALTEIGGPLNEETGDELLNVFYIHELEIYENYGRQKIGSRILQEVPYLVKKLLHAKVDILTYYPSPIEKNWYQESEHDKSVDRIISNRFSALIEPESENGVKLNPFEEKYNIRNDDILRHMGRRHSGSSYPDHLENESLIRFYQKNGFQEVNESRLMYAYVRK